MKVVLTKDLKGKGKKGDVIEVNASYAQNYLIPNQIAIAGNNNNLNEAKQKHMSDAYKDEQNRQQAEAIKKKVEGLSITIKVKCGANSKVFGSVTSKEISEELAKQGIVVDKKKIEIDTIKTCGAFTAKLRLYPGIVANLHVDVVAE